MEAEKVVRERLQSLCASAGISTEKGDEMWDMVKIRYTESHRYYHTLQHIADLLSMSSEAINIKKPDIVDWAIIYHDIIYDAKSKTNEEDSAEAFKEVMTQERAVNGEGNTAKYHIPEEILELVYQYIIETKAHKVADSDDYDLKLFIDWDMSILGAPTIEDYKNYILAVRKEYVLGLI